jgi:uncharacterized protein (DUF2267 family)
MRADDELAAYEKVYTELIEVTLSSLATVNTPESADAFAAQVTQQIRDLSARIPEFYALEFLEMFRIAVLNMINSEEADLKHAMADVEAHNDGVSAELTARLITAKAVGDGAAEHSVWQDQAARQAAGQAEVDELTRRLRILRLRLDAYKKLKSSVESKRSKSTTDKELVPDDGDEPRPAKSVYAEFTDATLSSLASVDTPELADAFAAQVTQQIRDLSARIPEFYALEFLDLLRIAVANMTASYMADLKQAKIDLEARNEAAAVELNTRLRAAKAASDRAAQHAVWRESQVRQANDQAEMDALTRRLGLVGLRLDAFKKVKSSLESAKLKRAPVQGDHAAIRADLPALTTPQAVASLPQKRLIRTAVDAEIAAAEFMRTIGFADAKRTPSGADGGIDVVATGAVAQVKTHMKPIGRPDLQRLCGAAKGRTTLFFSLEGFTHEARKWGDSEGMALFRFDYQGDPSPVNRVAKALMAARSDPPVVPSQ